MTFLLWVLLGYKALQAQSILQESARLLAVDGLKETIITVKSDQTNDFKQYVVAGGKQYRSIWAWDFAFASVGLIKVGYQRAVRDTLELYFRFQREDGFFPRVIDNYPLEIRVPLALIGFDLDFKEPLKPQYKTENGVTSFVPNAILAWTSNRYVEETQDLEFANKYFVQAEKSLEWLQKNVMVNGLICKQEPYSDWQDSIQRVGCVSFTNILYAYSLRGLARWARLISLNEKSQKYFKQYEKFKENFKMKFWSMKNNYYLNFDRDDHFVADTNLLAVAYGFSDLTESQLIMESLRKSPLWVPIPGKPTSPNYPKEMKSLYPRLVGLEGYHDEIHWGWITALAALAERALGRVESTNYILDKYSQQIITDRGVYEVYDLDQKSKRLNPVKRFFYKSEKPFTWGTGLFLEAVLFDKRILVN